MTRQEISVIDAAEEYNFVVAPNESGKFHQLTTRKWQPGHPVDPWRIPLHGYQEGLGPDRLFSQQRYAKANADASNLGLVVPPPKLDSFVAPTNNYVYDYDELGYGMFPYGDAPYVGASISLTFNSIRVLGNKGYFGGGNNIFSVTNDLVFTLEKTFDGGVRVHDLEVFQGKLYVALGEDEDIFEYDPSNDTWTQSTDSVFAIAFTVTGDKLWRAHGTNKLSNTIDDPLTLTNWAPGSPNEYTVGDTTFAIKNMVEYDGVPWVEKSDGIYAPNELTEFKNQAPQLRIWPNLNQDKTLFLAKGFLWGACSAGLVRMQTGQSIVIGPEQTHRPDYRFHTHGGVQFGDDIYLLCSDRAQNEETVIIRGSFGLEGESFTYHELVRLGSLTKGTAISILSTLDVLPPIVLIAQENEGVKYFRLGRGGGRHIDDGEYPFGDTWELETGAVSPTGDLGIINALVGIQTVAKLRSGDTLRVQYAKPGQGYQNLLSTQEGGGVADITGGNDYVVTTRYAPPNTEGSYFTFKVSGTLANEAVGTNRPELREWWAYGYSHLKTTDIIIVNIVADSNVRYRGIRQGRTSGEMLRILRRWEDTGKVLELRIPDYEESRVIRCRVVGLEETSIQEVIENAQRRTSVIQVSLARIDFAGTYARAE